jgi:hypothetical protein
VVADSEATNTLIYAEALALGYPALAAGPAGARTNVIENVSLKVPRGAIVSMFWPSV